MTRSRVRPRRALPRPRRQPRCSCPRTTSSGASRDRTTLRRCAFAQIGRPEAALIGVQYRANDEAAGRAVRRPRRRRRRGSGPGRASPTARRSASRRRLRDRDRRETPDSPPGTIVLAQIPDIYGPGITAEMTYYETPPGARLRTRRAALAAGRRRAPALGRIAIRNLGHLCGRRTRSRRSASPGTRARHRLVRAGAAGEGATRGRAHGFAEADRGLGAGGDPRPRRARARLDTAAGDTGRVVRDAADGRRRGGRAGSPRRPAAVDAAQPEGARREGARSQGRAASRLRLSRRWHRETPRAHRRAPMRPPSSSPAAPRRVHRPRRRDARPPVGPPVTSTGAEAVGAHAICSGLARG